MKRNKWIVGARNKLADIYMECDSCAAIEGAMMTSSEREHVKSKLKDIIGYIDSKLK